MPSAPSQGQRGSQTCKQACTRVPRHAPWASQQQPLCLHREGPADGMRAPAFFTATHTCVCEHANRCARVGSHARTCGHLRKCALVSKVKCLPFCMRTYALRTYVWSVRASVHASACAGRTHVRTCIRTHARAHARAHVRRHSRGCNRKLLWQQNTYVRTCKFVRTYVCAQHKRHMVATNANTLPNPQPP